MPGLASTPLFGRALKLVVGVPNNPALKASVEFNDANSHGADVSGFDVDFTIEKTLKPEPNTCDISVYNLSENSRKLMSGGHELTVELSAGYQGGLELLYAGTVRSAWTQREGPDFVTHIESGDTERTLQDAQFEITIGTKVSPVDALEWCLTSMGGLGSNLHSPLITDFLLENDKAFQNSINGAALTGSVPKRMTDLCRTLGLEWSIQNGAIQFLPIGQAIDTVKAISISSDTGLIESPSVDSKGVLSASCLLIPGIRPGVLVEMRSLFIRGFYRVERCKWHGQVNGNDWQVDFEATKTNNQGSALRQAIGAL